MQVLTREARAWMSIYQYERERHATVKNTAKLIANLLLLLRNGRPRRRLEVEEERSYWGALDWFSNRLTRPNIPRNKATPAATLTAEVKIIVTTPTESIRAPN
jgi:hypothetical protein